MNSTSMFSFLLFFLSLPLQIDSVSELTNEAKPQRVKKGRGRGRKKASPPDDTPDPEPVQVIFCFIFVMLNYFFCISMLFWLFTVTTYWFISYCAFGTWLLFLWSLLHEGWNKKLLTVYMYVTQKLCSHCMTLLSAFESICSVKLCINCMLFNPR